jgi:hypothetical protein
MLCNLHAHLSIGVFAIAQFGFYCISPEIISILLIGGYVYCWYAGFIFSVGQFNIFIGFIFCDDEALAILLLLFCRCLLPVFQ